jgi:lipoate-protein ligase A
VHEAVRTAIEESGYPAELATAESKAMSDSCFANPVPADVISRNRKIAGAAHRRTRAGLLHQGSIQNISIPNDLASAFARHLSGNSRDVLPDSGLIDRALQIAEAKYATPEWLRRW